METPEYLQKKLYFFMAQLKTMHEALPGLDLKKFMYYSY